MSWVIIAIFSYFLFALGNIFEKKLRTNNSINALTIIFLSSSATVFLLLLPLFLSISTSDIFLIIMAVISGVINVIAFLPYVIALKREEVSRLVSLWNFAPIPTFILAFFILQEKLPNNFYISFILLLIGGVLISFRDFKGSFSSYGFFMMMLSNLIYSVALVIMKYVLNFLNFIEFLFYSSMGHILILIILLALKNTRNEIIGDIKKIKHKFFLPGYMLIIITAAIFYILSIQSGPLSIVVALGSFQALFVFLLALIFSLMFSRMLKEETKLESIAIKATSILLMIIGLYLLQN